MKDEPREQETFFFPLFFIFHPSSGGEMEGFALLLIT
jgi:hypothetical protein